MEQSGTVAFLFGESCCFAKYFSGLGNNLGCPRDIPGHQVRVMHKHMAKDWLALGPDHLLFHLHSKTGWPTNKAKQEAATSLWHNHELLRQGKSLRGQKEQPKPDGIASWWENIREGEGESCSICKYYYLHRVQRALVLWKALAVLCSELRLQWNVSRWKLEAIMLNTPEALPFQMFMFMWLLFWSPACSWVLSLSSLDFKGAAD